jgi:hypothetical protein
MERFQIVILQGSRHRQDDKQTRYILDLPVDLDAELAQRASKSLLDMIPFDRSQSHCQHAGHDQGWRQYDRNKQAKPDSERESAQTRQREISPDGR